MAQELDSLGASAIGRRLQSCGATATAQTCGSCGDPHARVTVLAHCDVRACVLCARRKATRESARVGDAAARVAGYAHARGPATLRQREAELRQREAGRATPARDRDCERLRRHVADLRAESRGQWRWRLVTLSPAWQPSDAREYRVGALRGRIERVKAAWSRVWALIGVGGAAAAYTSIECSAGGHVHLHALVYGPWRTQKALAAVAECMVDVREAHGEAVREVAKYALKGPTPRGAWMAGASSELPHPALAAAWVVAARGRRLVEPYGLMRDALAASDAAAEGDAPQDASSIDAPRCATCGSAELELARVERTADLARACLALGADRWTLRPRMVPRGPLAHGPPMVLPPRVYLQCPTNRNGDSK